MRRASLLLLVLVTTVWLVPAALAATPVQDPDRNSTALTGWYWYHNVSPSSLNSLIASTGSRPVSIEVDSSSPLTFTVALVKNTGAYSRAWWWYYGMTPSQLMSYATANGARIVDVDAYSVSGVTRYVGVMVANTGAAAKSWWWYVGTAATINSQVAAHGARIIDLDEVPGGSLSAVMIANTGVDAKSWWWYYGATAASVNSALATNHARLVSLERTAAGRYDVAMVRGAGEYWWWYYNVTASRLNALVSQNGARLVAVDPYLINGTRYYAAVLLNDVNAETSRLREIMRAGLSGGSYGIYLKRVGGSEVVGLQQGTIFEPASAIKVLYHLYALRKVQAGTDSLSSPFSYWVDPSDPTNPGVCPDPAWETDAANRRTTTLQDGLAKMLQVSDNRTTRGMQLRYGMSNVNAMATSIGLAHTVLRQIIGCGFQNGLRNDFTLADAGKIYEGAWDGTLLTGSARTSFWSLLLGGPVASTSPLAVIVRDEATKLGKSSQVADDFIANMSARSKGGSYDICNTDCSAYEYIRTGAGELTIPFKTSGVISPRTYVNGSWVNGLNIPCAPKGASETVAQAEARCPAFKAANDAMRNSGNEKFRTVIRAALKTW